MQLFIQNRWKNMGVALRDRNQPHRRVMRGFSCPATASTVPVAPREDVKFCIFCCCSLFEPYKLK
ncbi:hypothetical protein HanRHA438_Chr15g0719991 [Helianthus annuus]|nr:hypothetical protein HanRHA438_Chr15g0719991 [Helianthus annuus]